MNKDYPEEMWYDCHPVLTYNAPLTIIEGGRGRGKTFSFKKYFLNNPRKGYTIWLNRTDTLSVKASKAFLEDLITVYPEYEDRYELGWVTQKEDTLDEKKKKIKYAYPIIKEKETQDIKIMFNSLNVPNKGISFSQCNSMFFDEFLIKPGTATRYLTDEVNTFLDIYQTVARLRKDFRCILMANEIDPYNPYHAFFGIEEIDKSREFKWLKKPDILFQWVQDKEEWLNAYSQSAFGRVVAGTAYDAYMKGQSSLVTYNIKMKPIPDYARYSFNLLHEHQWLAVWVGLGMIYVTDTGLDKSRLTYVSTLRQTGLNRLYDTQIKGMIKQALGKGGLFCTNKASRTKLLEWVQ